MIDLNKYAKPNKTIREHTNDLLDNLEVLNKLKYVNERDYKLLSLCCEYHDYGKINDEFQKRVRSDGRIKFDDSKEVVHNVLSLCFIKRESFKNIDDYYKVCYAILNHHHYTDNSREITNKRDLIFDFVKVYGGSKIGKRIADEIEEQKNDNQAILLKGLLHKCDYAASGDYTIEYKNDFLTKGLKNLLNKWKEENNNAKWNDLQEFCINKRDKNIIVIANTGMGKTEAGLLWIGDNKGFFILPLRTAINAIYDRVKKEIVLENIEKRVALLHSETLSYYLNKFVTQEEEVLEYSKRGKQLSLPLTISTLDQLFDFVYKYNGFELKLATLSYSKIVIDEIQAYSPDLLAYLVSGLEKIVKMGGKFAILTATFPPFIIKYIKNSIGDIEIQKFIKGEDRHSLEVIEEEINPSFIAEHFKNKGGKTLIVCNTVKKAQEIYDSLSSDYDIKEIDLIHAKYIKKDRKVKENEIIEFGKTEVSGNRIWVATSIVEASLDIDFDYLFTELNDLNGLFQRLGRINRKGKKKEMLKDINAYVFTEINKNLLINENGTRGFIDKKIYELSKKAILGYKGLLPEEKKVELIDKYLTSESIKGSNFEQNYIDIKEYIDSLYIGEKKLKDVQTIFRNIISYNVIPRYVYDINVSFIDENIKVIKKKFTYDDKLSKEENDKNKEKLQLAKVKARQNIYELTVSVGTYDLNKTGTSIKLGNEEIHVVKCKYDNKRGFERIKIEKKEDSFDRFS